MCEGNRDLGVAARPERRESIPRRAPVIELRFFGGLSVEETGQVLQVSAHTVMRDWRLARELSQSS